MTRLERAHSATSRAIAPSPSSAAGGDSSAAARAPPPALAAAGARLASWAALLCPAPGWGRGGTCRLCPGEGERPTGVNFASSSSLRPQRDGRAPDAAAECGRARVGGLGLAPRAAA